MVVLRAGYADSGNVSVSLFRTSTLVAPSQEGRSTGDDIRLVIRFAVRVLDSTRGGLGSSIPELQGTY